MKAEALRQYTRYDEWVLNKLKPESDNDSYLDLAGSIHNYGKFKVDALKLDWLKKITTNESADFLPAFEDDDEEETQSA